MEDTDSSSVSTINGFCPTPHSTLPCSLLNLDDQINAHTNLNIKAITAKKPYSLTPGQLHETTTTTTTTFNTTTTMVNSGRSGSLGVFWVVRWSYKF